MVTIVCIVLIVIIVMLTMFLDINKRGGTIIGLVSGVIITLLVLTIMIEEANQSSIKPIDVYRGKTMLEITYQDSIAVDSVVKWKE